MARRKSSSSKKRSLLGIPLNRRVVGLLIGVVLFLSSQIVVSVVPYSKVPPGLQPVYLQVLAFRNKMIARSGLPFDRYTSSATVEAGGANLQIYFAPSPSIDDHLVDFIDSATVSVAMAAFELERANVIEAMVRAKSRGCQVRLVTDSDYAHLTPDPLKPLRDAKIPIIEDRRNSFMHNKFVVIDGKRVWTGSYNFTDNGTEKNDNNALTLDSPALAANYMVEFEEFWAGEFGPTSPNTTPHRRIESGSLVIDTYFAPEDGAMNRILEEVRQAKRTVSVMAFSFTSDYLARELRGRIADGVTVRCLYDTRQAAGEYSTDEAMEGYGATVRLSSNRRGVLHHKVIIIDNETVITGSFNFSKSADTANDENLLIIHSPDVAAIYNEEFDRCWNGVKGY